MTDRSPLQWQKVKLRNWMGSYGFTVEGIFVHAKSFGAQQSVGVDLGAGSELMVKARPSQRKPGSWEAIDSRMLYEVERATSKGRASLLPTVSGMELSPCIPVTKERETAPTHQPVGKECRSSQMQRWEKFCPLLLITGRPGVGKTTVLRRLYDLLNHRNDNQKGPVDLLGFITNEVRDPRGSGQRVGFKLGFFQGSSNRSLPDVMMAHVDFPKSVSVGKYGVDVSAVDSAAKYLSDQMEKRFPPDRRTISANSSKSMAETQVGSTSVVSSQPRTVVLLDEIGRMECLSRGFVHSMNSLLYRELWYPQPDDEVASAALPVVLATIAEKGSGLISELKARPGVKLVEVTEANRESLPQILVDWIDSQ